MKNKILVLIIIISFVIGFSISVYGYVSGGSLHTWAAGRIKLISDIRVKYDPALEEGKHNISFAEASNRAKILINAAKKYNYLYPKKDPNEIVKEYLAILEVETKMINYAKLDNGNSFGMISMQWTTAESVAKDLDDHQMVKAIEYGLQSEDKHPSQTAYQLINNLNKQLSYGIYHYYELYQQKDGNRQLVILAYNRGPNTDIDPDKPRWRGYYFKVRGRLAYYND